MKYFSLILITFLLNASYSFATNNAIENNLSTAFRCSTTAAAVPLNVTGTINVLTLGLNSGSLAVTVDNQPDPVAGYVVQHYWYDVSHGQNLLFLRSYNDGLEEAVVIMYFAPNDPRNVLYVRPVNSSAAIRATGSDVVCDFE